MREYMEKRDLYRMQMRVPCPVAYSASNHDLRGEGMVENLSGSGVLFQTEEELSPGLDLDITINPTAKGQASLQAHGRVLRCEQVAERKSFAVACVFTEKT